MEHDYEYEVPVSIGIPVYNGARYITETLEAALGQTYRDTEIIISDNASTDNSLEICEKYAAKDSRIRIIKGTRNVGLVRNYRRVQAAARGKYFKMLAADDLIEPTFVERCVEVLEDDRDAILCTARLIPIDEQGEVHATEAAPNQFVTEYGERYPILEPMPALLDGDPVERFREVVTHVTGNIMVQFAFGVARRVNLDALPPLGLYLGAEKMALARLALAGRWRYIPENLMWRRLHEGHFAFMDLRRSVKGLDPEWSGRIAFPAGRQLLGYLQTIWDADISPADKARCLAIVGRHVADADRVRKLLPGPDSYVSLSRSKG